MQCFNRNRRDDTGTKVEIENLNSMRNVKRAIEFEAKRMRELAGNIQVIHQETRSFDALNGISFSMRSKEEANDYRYFPDPDLPPFEVNADILYKIEQSIPALPEELIARHMKIHNLSRYDAELITDDKKRPTILNCTIRFTSSFKAAWKLVTGPRKTI